MKLYAYTTHEIAKHVGFLKIGETNGDIDKRVKQQGHELNVKLEVVWSGGIVANRGGIDKLLHRYLKEHGCLWQQFDDTGRDTEWIKCTPAEVEKALAVVKEQLEQDEIKRQALGNKFYLEIRNWYYWASEQLPDPEAALRLIVRLLFCYFLKEKELVPKELFEERFAKEHLKDNEHRYNNVILRNLFFHCLNTPIKERGDVEHKNLIKKGSPITEQFKQIPFLNGGIFNEHEGDDIALNDDYFFSDTRSKHLSELGGNYSVSGIIQILSKYHYKLTLDDLLDREKYVETIDPEFIGKVFESLLACIDADSNETRRKVTGSYYTPREIVDYMVYEALNAYSQNPDDVLQCKILDPACGSGAFPCGIMNEIMRRLDPHRTLPTLDRYRRKLEIVRKVIYGVDIQPMAVQIAQLRLFLSLIQEIVPDKKKDNFGIEPLPNLETKFVCADALSSLKKKGKNGQRTLELPSVRKTVAELRDTRNQYFMAKYVQEKKRIQKEDESWRKMLGIALEEAGALTHDMAEKLVAWNPYNQSHAAPFFDPVWMFGIENFDIVIGNPPYIQLQKRDGMLAKKYEHCDYETFARMGDIYSLFYERGWQLLADGGHLCYITSNQWMRTGYGKSLRQFLSEKTNPKLLINFAGTKVFESATVNVNILLSAKETNKHQTTTHVIHNVAELKALTNRDNMSFSSSPWIILASVEQSIRKKIESIGVPLKQWDIQIYRGVVTGFNDAFVISSAKKDELIATDPKSSEIIRPLLRGCDIRRYNYDFADQWLITTFPSLRIDIDKYPAVKKHLLSFGKRRLEQTGKAGARKKTNHKWFETQDTIGYWENFYKPKIVWGNLNLSAAFTLAPEGMFVNAPCPLIAPASNYLLAILNSKVADYYIRNLGVIRSGCYFEYKPMFIEKMPVPFPTDDICKKIDKILHAKNYYSIDSLVYKLYGLTDEEIALIEKQ